MTTSSIELGIQEQLQFQKEWPIARLEDLTLEQYTNLERESSFTYWLEQRTEHSGGIWGGSSFKFGIYRRRNLEPKSDDPYLKTDGTYSWHVKYGTTRDEAFSKVKSLVVEVAKASLSKRFDEIDKIDLGPAVKWKIAFLYNPEHLVPIFKTEVLRRCVESIGQLANKKMPISEMQAVLLSQRERNESTIALAHRLWVRFNTNSIFYTLDKFISQAQAGGLKTKEYPKIFKGFVMQLSFGQGNLTNVPWIAFLRPPNTVSNGIYPVFLYYKDLGYLILSYGVSETTTPAYKWPDSANLKTISDWFDREVGVAPPKYGDSFIKAVYNIKDDINFDTVQTDLDQILDLYDGMAFSESKVEDSSKTVSSKRYWVVAPGEGARMWDEFTKKGIIGLGWDELGDLKKLATRENIRQSLLSVYSSDTSQRNNSLALWEFSNGMKVGDIVIAKRGVNEYLGYGIVSSDYRFDPSRREYRHIRDVDWKKVGLWESEGGKIVLKTLTDITKYPAYVDRLKRQIGIEQEAQIPETINYWWLNANPRFWKIADFEIGQEQTYTTHNEKGNKRSTYEYFRQLKPGDLMLGYSTSPIQKVEAIFEVRRGVYKNEESEQEEILFAIQSFLPDAIPIDVVLDLPEMQGSEILNNRQGSLFRLSKQEFDSIIHSDAHGEEETPPYTKADALRELFADEDELDDMLALLEYKRNLVLQGPPGTGKTFVAKLLAFASMEQMDKTKIETIQFHQSYAYEDFIQGYRPKEDGGFKLENGVFFRFCKRAQSDPNEKYFFIIDEINRGNLSKIFGELMLLIEADKRGRDSEIPLTYSHSLQNKFSVPANVYIIGTMNTADRSLALVDYALRRRFAFVTTKPKFNAKFTQYLISHGVDEELVSSITSKVSRLNDTISADNNLGFGFQIGHSYFCNIPDEANDDWFERIVNFEIAPLLREYWFDNSEKAESEIERLLK